MAKFKFIDLFSGLGGFRIALNASGGECVFSSDNDIYAQKTYQDNFNELPRGDITKIKASEVPDHDILTAGFPCQAFSIAGKRLGFNDTRGTLFFDVARIIKEKQPSAFILENVAGIVSHDKGNTLSIIETTLDELGYTFVWSLLNAKDHGVPQNRNRWYCIGVRNDIADDLGITHETLMNEVIPNKTELKTFVDDLLDKKDTNDYVISEIAIKNIKKNLLKYPNYQLQTKHSLIANNIRPSKVSFSASGISPCLTAKMGTGGNNVPVIVSQNRKMSVRECLRIMGFPDSYKINHKQSQAYKQIGNSVAVPVLTKISKNLVDLLYK